MDPYNQPYSFPQQTPGPPQPPWTAPARRSGWADPRFSQHQPQSPVSHYDLGPNALGPPLPPPPPPPPPPPAQHPPPPQFDTSAWGVRYNQAVAQHYDSKPPLPARPPSATGRISQQPDHAAANNSSQSAPLNAGSYQTPQSSQQFPTTWSDPYYAHAHPDASTFTPPPPPPPRPAEYQALIQAQHNTPHQEYSQLPPSHHYSPQLQSGWGAQPITSTAPTYHPTAPASQPVSATIDGPLVSPVESSHGHWGGQKHPSIAQTTNNNQGSEGAYERPGHAPALSFGGPSDWEHYEPGVPPEETPISPAATPGDHFHHTTGPLSTHPNALLNPGPNASDPGTPAEIGAPSPITSKRKQSHAHSPNPPITTSLSHISSRSSSPSQISGHVSTNGSGNYDSISQALNAPLQTRPIQEQADRPDSRSYPPVTALETPTSVKVIDPYADLEPEFKASLVRYAAMLRKESAAESEEEKFKIFQASVLKELRLRSLLYGVELTHETKEATKAAKLTDMQAALPTAVEPTPLGGSGEEANVGQKAAEAPVMAVRKALSPRTVSKEESTCHPVAGNAIPAEQLKTESVEAIYDKPPAQRPSISTTVDAVPSLNPERTSGANTDFDEEAYSPGGRPRINKVQHVARRESQSPVTTPPQDHYRQNFSASISSPSVDAPMVIEDYSTPNPPSPGANAPMLVLAEPPRAALRQQPQNQKPVAPIKFEPPRPVYTPFRYSAAAQDEKGRSLQPADQAYSSLRHSVADSGRLMAQDTLFAPARPSSAIGRKEHEEAFIGLIRKQSMAVRQKTPRGTNTFWPGDNATKPEPPLAIRVGTPANAQASPPLKQATTALQFLLPSDPSLNALQHPKLKSIKNKIDAVPDQFEFIREAVVEWDRTNREVRKQQDAERRDRQESSEAHIDALFNDNEIGYADIGDLEAEFKLAEAERQYLENKEELESFTAQVFTPVTERLETEIANLTTAYVLAIDLLDLETVSASQYFKSAKEQALMSEVMSCLLSLFNKIETRHRKVAEAHVERERRRKRLELTVLYTNGDTAGVKRLEMDFATAEKTQVLHEAREKDNRANKLVDAFDRATVRGLGDNQMFIDDIFAKLQEVKRAMLSADPAAKDQLYESAGARETLSLAQEVVDTVKADSQKLLALSNEADGLLNEADYAASVAEARVTNADKATYSNLETEKAKEDTKLLEEMNSRISSVTKGPSEAIALIRELIDRLGEDPEHQERIRKALEAAKQRNASTVSALP
ncbi:hypothetical protein A1O3_08553 [Capronia epimyces CBS 606.96]|uniref:Uncharacterized protein n=1 Tax=Capronia epimyces CBS 606.96 TaxID=1182542 RepID=W9XEW9_9EURO|nr:uncharacterized protein A1O3_08553 [Capronia epimyces CBS 606.96]EXJ79052.1 hypothetical protein A1O3_08553 [Capronia epimyces CBS 606.96]